MKNKNLLVVPVLALTATMLFACNKGGGNKPAPRPETYTVTFYNGDQVYETQEVEAHELATKPAIDPTKDGHEFTGWYTAQTGGEEWVFTVNEVTEDTDLYARFELGRVDYTINLLVGDTVAATKTANSEDREGVTLTAVEVDEGKSLLGYATTAGTTASQVQYRVDGILTFDQIVSLADENNVVNLHAIIKNGEALILSVAQWERYASDENINRVMNAFRSYVDENSVDYDFIDVTKFAAASSADENWGYANFAANINANKAITVVLPTNNNFQGSLNGLDATRIKQHTSLGVAIKDNPDGATVRYVTRLSDDAITVAFTNWLLSDDGKLALNEDYEPPKPYPVEPADDNKLVIGVWGRWLTEEHAEDVLDAWKTYAAENSVTYTEAKIEYYKGAANDEENPYFNKAKYLEAVGGNPAIDVIIPVTNAIVDVNEETADSDAKTYGITSRIVTSINLGTGDDGLGLIIEEKNDRAMATLNNDAITASFVAFVNTEEGKKALDPDYGEEVEVQTVLTISFFGNYISSTNAGLIVDKIEEYFTDNSITFTSIEPDYISGETATKNADYVAAISKDSDISIGGGAKLTNAIFADGGFIVVDRQDIGTIAGQTGRYYSTFNNGVLTVACAAYLLSTEGQAFLATLTA